MKRKPKKYPVTETYKPKGPTLSHLDEVYRRIDEHKGKPWESIILTYTEKKNKLTIAIGPYRSKTAFKKFKQLMRVNDTMECKNGIFSIRRV